MTQILRVLGDAKNASKIPPCRGDSLLERMQILERSGDGVRKGPGKKRRSDDAPEQRSALLAPPRVEVNLQEGRAPPWTTRAGPYFRPSGRGRLCRLPAARQEPAS